MIVTFDDRGVTEAMNGGGVGLLLPSNLSQCLCLCCCYLTTPPASTRLQLACNSILFKKSIILKLLLHNFLFYIRFIFNLLTKVCLPQLLVSATDNVT